MFPFIQDDSKKRSDTLDIQPEIPIDTANKSNSKIVRVTLDKVPKSQRQVKVTSKTSDPITLKYNELKLKCYKELEALRNELVSNKQFKVPQTVYTNQILLKFVLIQS